MSYLNLLLTAAIYVGPFVGYFLGSRRPSATRLQIVIAAGIGSGLPAAVTAAIDAALGMSSETLMPWVVGWTAYGLGIGICGLLARQLGAWLSRRP